MNTGKPILHFAHANGIPSAVYQQLLKRWQADFEVVVLPLIGTDPRFPVDDQWKSLVRQLIHSVEAQNAGQPVYLVGHSLGGLLSFLACYQRPELVRKLVMLDPPLIPGLASLGIHLAKRFHPATVDKVTPAGLSSRRREHWPTREEAAQSLRSKGFFKEFDAQCFADYIHYGLSDDPAGGVTLTIPRATEVAIFRHTPSLFWLTPRKAPDVPVQMLVGRTSRFYEKGVPQKLEKTLGIPYEVRDGGHMFPLEHPAETAARVKELLLG